MVGHFGVERLGREDVYVGLLRRKMLVGGF